MSNRWVRMLLVAAVGVLALAGKNLVERGGFDFVPLSGVAAKVDEACKAQRHAEAEAWEAAAKSPGKTVRETMEAIREKREASYEARDKAIADLVEPIVGKAELDPAKATVFADVAKGLRQ